jgi:hypothetical protein
MNGNVGVGTETPSFGLTVMNKSVGFLQEYISGNSAGFVMFDNTLSPGVEGVLLTRLWDSGSKGASLEMANIDLTKGYMNLSASDDSIDQHSMIKIFPNEIEFSLLDGLGINQNGFNFISGSHLKIPVGTDLERTSLPTNGMIRFNNDQDCVEGYKESVSSWACFDASSAWSLAGNAGTTAGTNFIGTTDTQDLVVKTNGVEVGRFGQQGNIAFGSDNTIIDPSLTLPTASNLGSMAFQSGKATGIYSTAFQSGQAGGSFSTAFGRSEAVGNFSMAWGADTVGGFNPPLASGEASTAFGSANFARSENETAFGQYGTDYSPTNTPNDRLLNIGNGISGSPSDALTILKNGQTGIAIDNFEANSNGNIFQVGDGSTGIIGYVDNSTGNWMSVSDERKKHNITDITYGLNEILQLKPVSFDYNRNNEHTIGFLAQQVLPIIPEAVSGDEEKGYAMSYSTLTPALVKAIQELNLKVDLLSMNAGSTSTDIFSSLKNWLADAGNGIGLLVTKIIKSEKVETKELCVDDVCVTRDQFRAMVQQSTVEQPPDTVIITPDVESNHEIVDPNIDSGNTTTTSTTDI